ncbi:MAG: MBL fold metallo-hydrolase [Calditrichaceae bacterium]
MNRSQSIFLHSFIFIFVLLCSGLFLPASQLNAADPTLKYNGHSFIKLKSTDNKVIYIDPYNVNDFSDSADVVLITHNHSDHNELSRIRQRATCQVIYGSNAVDDTVYKSYTIDNIKIMAVPAYNSYHSKNNCVGFVVEMDGIKIYHAGDTGKINEMADLAELHLDFALLPMDGTYTMTPEVATEAASMIQAKHDIPIHTMPPPDTYSQSIVDRFTSPNKLIVRPESVLILSQTTSVRELNSNILDGINLDQNYPNPFNPKTVISWQLAVDSHINLSIYNILGHKITTLVSGKQAAGKHQIEWNAQNYSSGVYMYKLIVNNTFVRVKKLMLLK